MIELGKTNPDQLESYRLQSIEQLISSASPENQRKLRGLQFKIDMICKKHNNPMGRCVAISKMMHESVHQLSLAFKGLLDDNARMHVPTSKNIVNNIVNLSSKKEVQNV